MAPSTEQKICPKCKKMMKVGEFYTHKDGSKFDLCKKCLTLHVDNFDPSTFLWILEEANVPYIPQEWNTLRDRAYTKDPKKFNGMSVLGKYFSKMRLGQWKEDTWEDTKRYEEELKAQYEALGMEMPAEPNAAEMLEKGKVLKEKYEKGEISEGQYRTLASTEFQNSVDMSRQYWDPVTGEPLAPGIPGHEAANPFLEDGFIPEDALPDPANELTDDDKLYLAMKWGRLYKPNEWIELEKKYNEMMASFDIQDSDTIGTLILICKTFLKMNQAIDSGDLDAYQKLARVYDSMRKSAKFTAAQNKDKEDDYVDCIGDLVVMCEQQGFIPRFATDIPQDTVDQTLADMNEYLRKLVTEDLGLGQKIEDQIKRLKIMHQITEDEENGTTDIEDEDYEEHFNRIQEERSQDKKVFDGGDED